jgi:hypothetical protein
MSLLMKNPDPYQAVADEYKRRTGKEVTRTVVKLLYLKWLYTPRQVKQ